MGLTEKPHSLVVSVGSRPKNITLHVHELSSKPSQPAGIQIFRREAFDFENTKWLCMCFPRRFSLWIQPSLLAHFSGEKRLYSLASISLVVYLLHVSIQDEEIYLWKSQSFSATDLFYSLPLSDVHPLLLCTGLSWHWQRNLKYEERNQTGLKIIPLTQVKKTTFSN